MAVLSGAVSGFTSVPKRVAVPHPASFESYLEIFRLGMPPHGGLAIGTERLTQQILDLDNVRQACFFPRDRYRITP